MLTGDKEISASSLLSERGRVTMDGAVFIGEDRAPLIDGLANHINDSSEGLWADGDHDRGSNIDDFLATDEAFSGVESNGAHVVATEMLGDFEDKSVRGALYLKSIQNWGKVTLKLHIDDGTNNGGDLSASSCSEAAYG